MSSSIGQKLRQAREAKKISLEQAAQATRIRIWFLEAIEKDDLSSLSSAVQKRGFVRAYASYLSLDPEPLLAEIDGRPAEDLLPAENEMPPSAVTAHTPSQAELIFKEIGQTLQTQRELLGLSLEDVERHTHLKIHYLEALELGDLAALPSPVQGRGMLNNYAGFLGCNVDAILLRFADGLQARLADRREPAQQTRSNKKRRTRAQAGPGRRLFSMDLWLTIILVTALVIFITWGAIRVASLRNTALLPPTAPSVAEVLASTASPSPTASLSAENLAGSGTPTGAALTQIVPVNETGSSPVPGDLLGSTLEPTASETLALPVNNSAIQIYLVVRQRAYVRVTADGKVTFEGRVIPGSAYNFSANERLEILTGNGAALQVFYNQTDLGPLGLYGQVVNRIYTLAGVQTPTPTITPTPLPPTTSTPEPSITPGDTGTPAP
jgi:cytoskeleton protein RodZ